MATFKAGDETMRLKAMRKGKTERNMLWKPPESITDSLKERAPKAPDIVDTVRAVQEGAEVCKQFSEQIRRGGNDASGAPQSFADLLSDMYVIGADLVHDLKQRGDPSAIKDRAEAFKSVARALPMLQSAEMNAGKLLGASRGQPGKKVEDMTHAELRAIAKQIVGKKEPNE